jgi:thiol:disulfide interchange protein
MTARLKTTAQLFALACVAGLLALLVYSVVHQEHAPGVGSKAPVFTLRRLEGPGRISLASYRGKPVVLNFWASWCECSSAIGRATTTAASSSSEWTTTTFQPTRAAS